MTIRDYANEALDAADLDPEATTASLTEERLRIALSAYFTGIETDDAYLAFEGVGELLSLTCPFEPETGEQAILSEEDGERFIATEQDFLRLSSDADPEDAETSIVYWTDIEGRIEEFSF